MIRASRILASAFVLALCFAPVGCASSGGGGPESSVASGSPDEISSEQLREVGRMTAYDAIRRIRPRWLRKRGVDSFSQGKPVTVYLDGQRYGSIELLKRMQTTTIDAMAWLDGMQATQRYGLDHGAGVILVTSMKPSGA